MGTLAAVAVAVVTAERALVVLPVGTSVALSSNPSSTAAARGSGPSGAPPITCADTIGVVSGDDLLGRLDGLIARGHELKNLAGAAVTVGWKALLGERIIEGDERPGLRRRVPVRLRRQA